MGLVIESPSGFVRPIYQAELGVPKKEWAEMSWSTRDISSDLSDLRGDQVLIAQPRAWRLPGTDPRLLLQIVCSFLPSGDHRIQKARLVAQLECRGLQAGPCHIQDIYPRNVEAEAAPAGKTIWVAAHKTDYTLVEDQPVEAAAAQIDHFQLVPYSRAGHEVSRVLWDFWGDNVAGQRVGYVLLALPEVAAELQIHFLFSVQVYVPLLQRLLPFVQRETAGSSDCVLDLRSLPLAGPEDSLPQVVSVDVPLTDVDKTLLQRAGRGYSQLQVERELSGGFSGARVLLGHLVNADGFAASIVSKLGFAAELRRERDSYRSYVKLFLPFCVAHVDVDSYNTRGSEAALNYGFVGGHGLGQVVTLEDYYRARLHDALLPPGDGSRGGTAYDPAHLRAAAERMVRLLDELLDRNLGQSWYAETDALNCLFAAEYSRQLPEHLRLALREGSLDRLWGAHGRPAKDAGYRPIAIDNIPGEHSGIEPGALVSVEGLVATRVGRRGLLLEDPEGRGVVVGVELPGERTGPDLNAGEYLGVRGQVLYNRHDRMHEIVDEIWPEAASADAGETIRLPGGTGMAAPQLTYPHPLAVYPKVLHRFLRAQKSYGHGDLHPRNILVDERDRPWLIDFGMVGKRHNIFDFVKLEARLRTWNLSTEGDFSWCDYLRFEESLEDASLLLSEYSHWEQIMADASLGKRVSPPDDPHLLFAYLIILSIRQVAQKYMRPQSSLAAEYLPALFLYCLGIPKHHGHEGKRAAHFAFATTCVLGRYI